jgi:transcriptional regulator with XRE-family HTH domain
MLAKSGPCVRATAYHVTRHRRVRLLTIVSSRRTSAGPPAGQQTVKQGISVTEQWDKQMESLGDFIRSQRKLANLSLRQLADLTSLSNPYLSQLERGMHQPSVRVLKAISGALNVSAERLLAQAGLLDEVSDRVAGAGERGPASVEAAIEADERLDDAQKAALTAVYRSMLRP